MASQVSTQPKAQQRQARQPTRARLSNQQQQQQEADVVNKQPTLARMSDQQQQQQEADVVSKQPAAVTIEETDNPVGKLQEVCQRRLLPLPAYTFVGVNEDKPEMRQFTCTARLQGRCARGVGKSKRLAKREAAVDLLRQLQATTPSRTRTPTPTPSRTPPPPLPPTATPAKSPLPLDEADCQRLRGSKWLQSAARAGAEVGGLFRGVRNRKAGAALPPIEVAAAAGPSACEQLLELGRAHRFGVQFLQDAEKLSEQPPAGLGSHRSVVKLCTMPTIVVVGNGADAADSREQACRAALEYLALLTKETQTTCTGKK